MHSQLYKTNIVLFFVLCFYLFPSKAFSFWLENVSELTLEIKEDGTAHLTGYFLLTDVQELIVRKAPKIDYTQIIDEAYKEDIQNLLASKIFIFVNRTRCHFTENHIEFSDGEKILLSFRIDALPQLITDCQIDLAPLHTEDQSSYLFKIESPVLQDSVYLNRDNFYNKIFAFPYKKEKNLDFSQLYLIGGIVLIWVVFIFWLIRSRKEDD